MFFVVPALAVIGAVVTTVFILDSLRSPLELIISYLMPYFLPGEEQSLVKRFGPWAAVTGCTDGIGRQYALELARRGLSLVLISRNPDKLAALAGEIEKQHGVKTKVIVADFSHGAPVYEHIERELGTIPVGILVNNVGVNYPYPMPLCEVPAATAWELVAVNAGAVTLLSRLLLARMAARGAGALVNVSSGSELQPLPLMTVYAATKAYVRSFTHAVREEYASRGIVVQHVSPLFVSTKMNAFSERVMRGSLLVPDAESYARSAVATLGRVQDTTGFWSHGLQYTFIKMVPVWLRTKIGHHLNKQFREEYMQNSKVKSN
ncbi:inactive hydroxysteroid dehydrogenase-like protein 1 isoform X2 [Plutella xylostella]|uniref:inactive hydroxysteroid dehydrogenase-like protein 1 isoform X1 n=1 Tax=Plutella xylostella TaxID=51655 RepID=UPI0020324251|nr:inactive hydroxysteroid dehydrogenase-like protein 1 isoform X1 [Plutella xylostella]XP_048487813.1 inactive hydroxysteroid dehydrogenase-like protein 1 isoform X2 [Plutella xylostella]